MKQIALDVAGGGPVTVDLETLIVAGFTGRDAQAVRRHVDELATEGIAAPEQIPAFYVLPVELLTTDDEIVVDGTATSGEVEPVVFVTRHGTFVGVGSDHTDRDREKESIAESKRACAKVAGRTVVPLDSLADRWDDLSVRSTVDEGRVYQNAKLAELLPVAAILDAARAVASLQAAVVFCGTVPLVDGFVFSDRYSGELLDVDGTVLASYAYRVDSRTTSSARRATLTEREGINAER